MNPRDRALRMITRVTFVVGYTTTNAKLGGHDKGFAVQLAHPSQPTTRGYNL
ncbi:MAG: hypothetical protein ABR555_19540 [Pyrinomonadaceae bacterium]